MSAIPIPSQYLIHQNLLLPIVVVNFSHKLLLLLFLLHFLILLLLQIIMIVVNTFDIISILEEYLVHEDLLVPVIVFILRDKFLVDRWLSHHEASNLICKIILKLNS